jgi:hypothetical protein
MNLRRRISELRKLADSDDWWDRELAGFALHDLIEDHFVEGMKLTIHWPTHRSARIRRVACQSLMQRKAKTTDDRLRPILKRLEILMNDGDIYVRKCCGPYVVAYLAYTYPRIVIPWLKDLVGAMLLDLLGPPGWCSGCWPHDGEVAGGAVASSF